ncbi:hypothetical protein LTR47_000293 [Exophiala xenobiotica]|nr:hypothetical protein LTR47_000293 [Exophiala xenobiotica]KAK5387357.1 hypothetical protein LTR11_001022 [Exophiala xenobiotica]KAK5407124.1 hypothetical protein LTR06_007865 [Exophiala xenobiotica]
MSGLEVIGGISGVIAIIDGAIKVCDSARKDLKLGDAFEAVQRRLPVILDTLQTCENHLKSTQDSIPTDVWEALEETVDTCHEKAGNLRGILEKVIPSHGDGWKKQYLKIVKRLGKGNKVEELMISITEDVQLIVNHHSVQSAKPEQKTDLDNIIEEMKSVKSSVPEEENAGNTFNSGGGAQTNNLNSGSGQQINNNASVGTQHIGSATTIHKPPTDFSFRKDVGKKGPCLGQAPYIEPSLFIGRMSEVDAIGDILKPGDTCGDHRRLVLGGVGGIGKTQLALAYARYHREFYQSVFWLNAASEAALKDSFRSIAEFIFETQEPGLLDDERIHARFEIEKYYPPASHGSIIITTRLPDKVAGSILKLGPLQNRIDDGLEILQSRSRRQNVASDPHAKRLVERLAGLPLALATAGAYLHRSLFTFERYLREYEDRFEIDPKRPFQLQEYQDRTLYTTWDISYSQLQKEDPIAAKLLKLLAYFDNQSLWYELFSAGFNHDSPEWLREVIADDLSFASVMGRLTEYCFIEVQVATKSWSMHNCIHDWTLAMLNKDLDGRQFWYAFNCVAASIKGEDWESFGRLIYNRLATHATRLVQVGFQGGTPGNHIPPNRLEDAQSVAYLLSLQIRHEPAEQIYQHVLAGTEQELGPTHIQTLQTFNNVGILYMDEGKLEQAEEYCLRALTGYEQELGPAHKSTLDTVNNVGVLYSDQGKLEQAEKYYLRALAGRQQALGPTHPSTLDTVNNLGLLYTDQCNLVQAEKYYLRALTGCEQELGLTHPSTLDTVHNLGLLYKDQGNLVQAEEYYLRALVGKEQALGLTHPSTLDTVNNLGVLYNDQGKLAQEEGMYRRALAGYEKNFLSKTIPALNTIYNLGLLFRDQGKAEEARAMFHRALSGRHEVFGPDHPRTLEVAKELEKLRSISKKKKSRWKHLLPLWSSKTKA